VFPKIEVPQNGWFIMENPIKMDDLGVPPFSETSNCFFIRTNLPQHNFSSEVPSSSTGEVSSPFINSPQHNREMFVAS